MAVLGTARCRIRSIWHRLPSRHVLQTQGSSHQVWRWILCGVLRSNAINSAGPSWRLAETIKRRQRLDVPCCNRGHRNGWERPLLCWLRVGNRQCVHGGHNIRRLWLRRWRRLKWTKQTLPVGCGLCISVTGSLIGRDRLRYCRGRCSRQQ